ncbi:MAG: hypothetical protein ACOC1F_05910 [Myxococcota bacterium]
MAARRRPGPGIVKVRHPRPHGCQVASLTHADDALWALLFDQADIVSEGAVDREDDQLVYRGTTSIILPLAVLGGEWDQRRTADLTRIASIDPHLRLRAVRIARREAFVRASGTLQSAQMDVVIRPCDQGVRIDIEVDAQVDAAAAGANNGR